MSREDQKRFGTLLIEPHTLDRWIREFRAKIVQYKEERRENGVKCEVCKEILSLLTKLKAEDDAARRCEKSLRITKWLYDFYKDESRFREATSGLSYLKVLVEEINKVFGFRQRLQGWEKYFRRKLSEIDLAKNTSVSNQEWHTIYSGLTGIVTNILSENKKPAGNIQLALKQLQDQKQVLLKDAKYAFMYELRLLLHMFSPPKDDAEFEQQLQALSADGNKTEVAVFVLLYLSSSDKKITDFIGNLNIKFAIFEAIRVGGDMLEELLEGIDQVGEDHRSIMADIILDYPDILSSNDPRLSSALRRAWDLITSLPKDKRNVAFKKHVDLVRKCSNGEFLIELAKASIHDEASDLFDVIVQHWLNGAGFGDRNGRFRLENQMDLFSSRCQSFLGLVLDEKPEKLVDFVSYPEWGVTIHRALKTSEDKIVEAVLKMPADKMKQVLEVKGTDGRLLLNTGPFLRLQVESNDQAFKKAAAEVLAEDRANLQSGLSRRSVFKGPRCDFGPGENSRSSSPR